MFNSKVYTRNGKEINIAARATSNPSNNLLSVKRKLLVKIRTGLRATVSQPSRTRIVVVVIS